MTQMSAPGRTRTCGQVLRRHLLYPLSYGGRVVAGGLEPGVGWSVALPGAVDHGPGTRIGLLVACPWCFTSATRCGGSVKRS